MDKRVKILVVDDEPDLCDAIAEQISKNSDVSCDCAHSAEEATEFIERCDYDILLSDIKMPGMNGLDLVKTIKNDPSKSLLCFIMTGFSSFTEEQVKEAGALGLYLKPEDFPIMISEIKNWVKQLSEGGAKLRTS